MFVLCMLVGYGYLIMFSIHHLINWFVNVFEKYNFLPAFFLEHSYKAILVNGALFKSNVAVDWWELIGDEML
jgi:hypothetical protein